MNKYYFDKLVSEINKSDLDAMLICPSEELEFLTDFTPSMCERFQGLFVKRDGKAFYICNLLYYGQAVDGFNGSFPVYSWFDGEVMTEVVTKILEKEGLCGKKIGVNTSAQAFNVLDLAESANIHFVNGKPILAQIRIIKTDEELNCMRRAAQIADNAVIAVKDFIKAGMTEGEISAFLHKHMEDEGGTACKSIVASGPNSSYPHYHGLKRVIQKGDPIVIDFGCAYKGLRSDTTRTYFVGSVSERQRELYNYVNEANYTAERKAALGVEAAEVDKAARDVIEASGYGETMTTRVGHGIGYSTHEQPDIKGSNHIRLEKGMCFSIEPGIYIAGDIGIRVEDIVMINEKGETEVLNKSPREITIVDKD